MDIKAFKQKLLDQLYEPYKKCMQCPLATQGRTHVVFGEGNPDASLMFIGEAPGRDEDLQGRPFVGRSGKLLTAMLEKLGIRRADVFIGNIVKCRPPENRAPIPIEIKTCTNILLFNQIKIIGPETIVTLGATAFTGLTGKQEKMADIRGKVQKLQDIDLIPTYHPAYILRNPAAYDLLYTDIKLSLNK